MGATVVRPEWVEKCMQFNRKVDEREFLITNGITPSDAAEAVLSMSWSNGCSVEYGRTCTASSSSSSSSSSFQTSQSSFTETRSGCESLNIRGRASSSSVTVNVVDRIACINQAPSNPSRNSPYLEDRESCNSFIPLPSYREHNSGVLPVELKVHRRSERICDLEDEVSDTEQNRT